MRCSARRSRAAATISIARVIFWMFLTLAMRLFRSFWAIAALDRGRFLLGHALAARSVGLGLDAGPTRLGSHVARPALVLVHRQALLVEVVAEVLGEALDGVVELALDVVFPLAGGEPLEEVLMLGMEPLRHPLEELVHALDLDAVEIAVGGGVDLHHLILDRQRLALVLVQRGDQALAPRKRALRLRVELGSELREG